MPAENLFLQSGRFLKISYPELNADSLTAHSDYIEQSIVFVSNPVCGSAAQFFTKVKQNHASCDI